MNKEKQKILKYSTQRFLSEGFSKITMDEIASGMHISKKTIYKHFQSKDDLLEQCVMFFLNENAPKVEEVLQNDDSSIEKFRKLFDVLSKLSYKVSDKWLRDIRIHKPDLWEMVDEFRTKRLKLFLSSILQQGIDEGYINKIPVELLFTVFMSSIRAVVSPDFISQTEYSLNGAINDFLKLFFGGLLTDAGKEHFQNLISENK